VLAAAPILCALLSTVQVPTGTLGYGFAGSRVWGSNLVQDAASGRKGRPSQGPHWPSPFTYGEPASGPSRQYNGRVFDPGTGFHDYGARMYWPEIGRFISADSVMGSTASPMTLNRYSYVLNNPYKYTDPTGKAPNQAGATDWHHVAGALQSGSLS
jgi:RHS repeat-associated protein